MEGIPNHHRFIDGIDRNCYSRQGQSEWFDPVDISLDEVCHLCEHTHQRSKDWNQCTANGFLHLLELVLHYVHAAGSSLAFLLSKATDLCTQSTKDRSK